MQKLSIRKRSVAIGGLGAIGSKVAISLLKNRIPNLTLNAVSSRNIKKAQNILGDHLSKINFLPISELGNVADIVIECLPSKFFNEIAIPTIEKGSTLIVLSSGALLNNSKLLKKARQTGSKIIVPSGAILALDAIKAANEGKIYSVKITTRKPPQSLEGAPFIQERGLNLKNLTKPLKIFEGKVKEAINHFPANVNVAASVSLAGIGPNKTMIEIWADPLINRNTQSVKVESDCSNFSMSIETIPDSNNPRTGKLTYLSVLATLKRLSNFLIIGT